MSGTSRWFAGAPVAQADRARAEISRHPSLRAWWGEAERGDWMLWAAGRAGIDSRMLVSAALDCVQPVLEILDEESAVVAHQAMSVAAQWVDGRVGPGECRAAAQKVYREAERTMPIEDPRKAAARTSALGAVESVVQAASSDDHRRVAEFTAEAARRAAGTLGRMHGPDDAELAHARCADLVRAKIPVRLLPED